VQLEERFRAEIGRLHPGGGLGLAVSGGGDSIALLHLAALWAHRSGARLEVASVDHGLRPESAEEARGVAIESEALGLSCALLRWEGAAGRGNLQARARDARSRLLADWAESRGLAAIATGHTRDDQAETVLMRLARGSGVDGLCGIPARARRAGALWLRPLLGVGRAELREWLSARGVVWRDDPSNMAVRFDRVRARQALANLSPLGIDAGGLTATATHMARARVALESMADAIAATAGHCGERYLRVRDLCEAPDEIALRALAAALSATSGNPYRPRFAGLTSLLEALRTAASGGGRTLHGCRIVALGDRETILIAREPAAAEAAVPVASGVWDGRWSVRVNGAGMVRALGEAGLGALRAAARAGAWRAPGAWGGAPRSARLSAPGLWRDGVLACAPLAAYGKGLAIDFIDAASPR
jgi:tRNA(Ile)-lysidine synthase